MPDTHGDASPKAPAGPWELIERLGRGSQGTTWRAVHRDAGEAAAVKVFRLDAMDDWKAWDLFERECRVLESLDHPGIPRYLGRWQDEAAGRFYLAMELVDGRSLEHVRAEQRPLEADTLRAVLSRALDILEYLHGLSPPVVHRDIKPANLVLSDGGELHLVDFGGVRVALRPDGGSTVVGTFGYMAPEQLHGEATPATDLYALGITLCALASGMDGEALPRKGLKVDVGQVIADERLRGVVSAMVEPDPSQRPATVAGVRALLDPPTPALRPERAAPPAPLRDSRLPPPIQTLVWLFGVAANLGLMFLQTICLPVLFWFGGRMSRRRPRRIERLKRRRERLTHQIDTQRLRLRELTERYDPDKRRRPDPRPKRLEDQRHRDRRPRGRRRHGRGRGRRR